MKTLLLLFIITIFLAAASFCYAGQGHIGVNVVEMLTPQFGYKGPNDLVIIDTGE